MMAQLILLLLAGGTLAWASGSLGRAWPRWVSLLTLAGAGLYLLAAATALPPELFSLTPMPSQPESWLMHESHQWIPRFGIRVELALDGLSLILLALTLLLGIVAVLSSWNEVEQRNGFFHANLMWTLAGVAGVFLAVDLFLFFLFWEVMLVPMYLLIAIWGHERRAYAAMKFFIFTQFSGLLMLFSILVLASIHQGQTGQWSFSYFDLLDTPLKADTARWIMLGFFVAFTVKLPSFPFHTWLPDAHTQAPTAGSVVLAGILLKTGAYGLLRFAIPLFPDASLEFAPVALGLGAVGVIYGAFLALGQSDFKRLVAYSSVSHMGFVLLGLYAWNTLAIQGAVMQMVAHGVSTAALFMTAGALQHRLHTRDMEQMGGLWQAAPRMGACTLFFVLASLGLPGLGNFVAEFLVLMGLFQEHRWLTAVAALGLVTAAVYSLSLMQRAFLGEPGERLGAPDEGRTLQDYDAREMATMLAMMAALVWLGLNPQPVLSMAEPVIHSLLLATGR